MGSPLPDEVKVSTTEILTLWDKGKNAAMIARELELTERQVEDILYPALVNRRWKPLGLS